MENSAIQEKVSGRSRGKKPSSFANDYDDYELIYPYQESEETRSKEVDDPMVNEIWESDMLSLFLCISHSKLILSFFCMFIRWKMIVAMKRSTRFWKKY